MTAKKRSQLTLFLCMVAKAAIAGLILGGLLSYYETHNLIISLKKYAPNDPRDGVWIIGLAITVIGVIIGTVSGLLIATIAALRKRRRTEK